MYWLWAWAIWVIVLALVGACGVFIYLTLNAHVRSLSDDDLGPQHHFDAVSINTYKPSGGKIPERGKRVAEAAVRWAKWYKCSILHLAGQTIKGNLRTESEIYARYIREDLKADISIITGQNLANRSTYTDICETYKYCIKYGLKNIVVMGCWPHMPRIIKIWSFFNKGDQIKVQFVGVEVPLRWYLWEFSMWIAEFFLPAGSQRRELILDLIGRRA